MAYWCVLRVRAQNGQRIDARSDLGLDGFARICIGISRECDEQHAQRASCIKWKDVRCVAEQSHAAIGDSLRLVLIFLQRESFVDPADINEAMIVGFPEATS